MTIADLRIDLAVEYLGEADPVVVLSEDLTNRGIVLLPGHPGRISKTTVQHVQANWVGLEGEPASYALGFSVRSEEDTTYYGLGLLSDAEFARRRDALEAFLAGGDKLSDGTPPWTV